jgi:predicted AlkP superfamily phosphohydrolase/phosphomutase
VRYLRLLSNAIVTGLIGAAYLTILVLQLNPHLPLLSHAVMEWYIAIAVLYGVHLAIGCYLAMMALEVVGFPVSAPAWISVRLQAWTSGLACAAAAALMWLNLRALSVTIGEEASRRMAAGAVGTSGVALVLLALAVIYYSVGRRGSRPAAAVLFFALGASMALPVAARGVGDARPVVARRIERQELASASPVPPGRVVMVMLEGASLEYLWPRAVEGRFPNIGRILDRGAAIDLATLRPTQPEPVWASVATGKYPPRTGLTSSVLYYVRSRDAAVELLPDYVLAHALVRFGLVWSEPHTSASWRSRPIWSVLGSRGLTSGIVRWPATYPAGPVRGFVVSDRLHQVSSSLLRLADESLAHPPEALNAARDVFSASVTIAEVAPVPANRNAGLEMLQAQPTRWDRLYGRVARELAAQYQPDFVAVRFTGVDSVGHTYLRYAVPREFGDVPEAEVRQFGGVLDRYYALLDEEIGRVLDALGPGDLLLVVSGFGMEPMTVPKRLLARLLGDPRTSGTHERAPDGFLLAYGAHVRSGKLPRGAVVDIAPTVLYYLGLPVGRDMDGYARTDLFVREFTVRRPIVFIPSYDR